MRIVIKGLWDIKKWYLWVFFRIEHGNDNMILVNRLKKRNIEKKDKDFRYLFFSHFIRIFGALDILCKLS